MTSCRRSSTRSTKCGATRPRNPRRRHTEKATTAPYRLRAQQPGAAATAVLGPATRTYYAAAHSTSIVAITPFALLLAYIMWLGHQGQLLQWFNSMFSAVAVSILFVLAIALIAYTSAVGGGELVRVHANPASSISAQRAQGGALGRD